MKDFVRMPFRGDTPPPWYGAIGYPAAVLVMAVATGVLWIAQPVLSLGSVYLVYLVSVVAVAVGWGWKQGFVAASLAFLAANYFFTPPGFTFTIAAPQDILALVIFFGIAMLTSQLVARLRQEARDARRNEQITNILYNLSQSINRQHNLTALLQDVAEQLSQALDSPACTISLSLDDAEGTGSLTVHSGPLLDLHSAQRGVLESKLVSGKRSVGVLLIKLPEGKHDLSVEERRIVSAFAEQLNVAFERYQGQQAAIQAEVLRSTDALRAALLSTVAHDLRTPLGSIKAAATSLLDPPVNWPEEDEHEFLKTIVGEVNRINRLVTNLLDMARIEAGQLQPQKEPRQIGEIIETVLEHHLLKSKIEDGLPTVLMDPVEIDEVLTNLIENAIKYTPQGTPLEVSAERIGGFLEVAVADRGPGIPPEKMLHLFDRFYRVTSGAGHGVEGTGLGLAIAKGIVEAHGGQVQAEARVKGGMVFRFTLPIKPIAQQEPTRTQPTNSGIGQALIVPQAASNKPMIREEQRTMATINREPQRFVLLVEDDEQLRNTVARTLRAAGYMVLSAGSFKEALDKISVKPHILILDINLPDVTGWNVAQWLQDQTTEVPIIVISGMTPDPEQLKHFKSKAFLPKPFGMRELLNLVEKYAPTSSGSPSQ